MTDTFAVSPPKKGPKNPWIGEKASLKTSLETYIRRESSKGSLETVQIRPIINLKQPKYAQHHTLCGINTPMGHPFS